MQLYKNFIDGKWIESESKETIKVDDPATGKVFAEIACAKKTEVDQAVQAAKNSFVSSVLVDMPLLERAKLMHNIADETRKIANEGGKILCYENGKLLSAGIKEFHMDIFNRWGEKIFSSDDTSKSWDGTYRGEKAQIDVYVWKISYTKT